MNIIAVATERNDSTAEISPRGARALFYMIFAEDGQLSTILENPFAKSTTDVGQMPRIC
jgi:hypothetical protein